MRVIYTRGKCFFSYLFRAADGSDQMIGCMRSDEKKKDALIGWVQCSLKLCQTVGHCICS